MHTQSPRSHPKKPQITVTYQRRRPEIDHLGKNNVVVGGSSQGMNNGGCVGSVANSLRTSWNRSLSTRGRVSVAAPVFLDYLPQKQPPRREPKSPIPKGKNVRTSKSLKNSSCRKRVLHQRNQHGYLAEDLEQGALEKSKARG
ncbi:hypothetical protein Drorol1_Dr00019587 [Drosera rotundifolia]